MGGFPCRGTLSDAIRERGIKRLRTSMHSGIASGGGHRSRSCAIACRPLRSWAPSSRASPLSVEREGLGDDQLIERASAVQVHEEVRAAGRTGGRRQRAHHRTRLRRDCTGNPGASGSGMTDRRGRVGAVVAGEMPFTVLGAAHAEARASRNAGPLLGAGRFGCTAKSGQDTASRIPFAAISAIPAATSYDARHDGQVRFEVPRVPARSKCTGCSQCWVQCPDSAIPGVVNSGGGGPRRGHRRVLGQGQAASTG